MIIFETTESVIEILWDVALAFFASRIALIYFTLNFTSGLIIHYLLHHHLLLAPHSSMMMIITSLLMLAIPPLYSRMIIQRYEIPRVGVFRLAIGAVALVLMVLAEGFVSWVGQEEGWWNLRSSLSIGNASSGVRMMMLLGWLAWYALMPFGMMFLERREEEEKEEEEKEVREVGEDGRVGQEKR